MKPLLFSTVLLLVFQHTFSQSTDLKRYPIENCKITYKIEGDATGEASRYISNWGWKERFDKQIKYEMYGVESLERRTEIRKEDQIYVINPETLEGTLKEDETTRELLAYKSPADTKDALFLNMGGKKAGKEIHLGKEATRWNFEKGNTRSILEWNGIILQEVKHIQNIKYTITSMNINLEQSLDDELFTLPDGLMLIQE